MKNLVYKLMLVAVVFGTQNLMAQVYVAPPSSTTSGSVPWISDNAMEACVVLYNETKWFKDEIQRTPVDNYSQTSVNNYNKKINKHSGMIAEFNRSCAGKQSKSAYEAAQRLSRG